MEEQKQNIRDKKLYKFASAKRYIKIHVPDFAFKHDDNNVGKDKFVGRELQIRRLFTWLTSDSKSGSYLITGYRGMGKSLLVKRVIDMISREPKAYKEVMFQFAMILTLIACFIGVAMEDQWTIVAMLCSVSVFIVALLEISKRINQILFEYNVHKVPLHHIFDKNMIAKIWMKNKDRRNRKYSNIAITVNLGQETLDERDVLSLIANNIHEKYYKFVHNRQNRPIANYMYIIFSGVVSFIVVRVFITPLLDRLGYSMIHYFDSYKTWISSLVVSIVHFFEYILSSEFVYKWRVPGNEHTIDIFWIVRLLYYMFFYYLTVRLLKAIRKQIPFFSTPYNSLNRLEALCERVASSLNEERGTHPQYSSSFFNFSFGKAGKSKSTPIATVRELEQELMGIVNNINGEDCPKSYCAQFIIVFDELDKIANSSKKNSFELEGNDDDSNPTFESSLRGFTDTMAYEERKQKVLRLLANMKLFITSVKAKCVFISGYELFDASLADLSDREFAISSIFNGVLNVNSFLSPEREESDVSSMTEVYLATMLLPESFLKGKIQRKKTSSTFSKLGHHLIKTINEDITRIISFWPGAWPKSYLKQKVRDNILKNGVLKDEIPSLRWYNEYLMDIHILENEETLSNEELMERELEIRHVMEFLRCFCVYLSQISNGSPKKIAAYFEKYVRVNFDTIKQFNWHDEIVVGQPTEDDVRKQCVLYFDPEAQKLVNFVHYIAAPVMNAITNEVSHYGDKLLVSSSFMLDQIYKYHGKGFSWRNLEQMPELLNTNKNPELRDALASTMEFLLQTHITTISSGIFQYKFHKQIAEEISMLSKTSEEAAAIFNFTLNESETVKRYNTRLLWNYLNLNNQAKDENQKERYCGVLERLHENQGDIYFSEEDYYRAIHEYRSALQYINEDKISPRNLIAYLKCCLKIGMSYEYRHTFENAYMVYCQIINNLIQLRWMEEGEFGLGYTMRLTHDWRIKQTVLVDSESLVCWLGDKNNKEARKQFKSGLLEDIRDDYPSFRPSFSIDSDKTVSSLAKKHTPEKSELFLKLTAFEDIKFIYQAIIAKLFVIEKMESSGITQSSIDASEAEFKTLYGITNHNDKYILASDFFCKLASVLYYKNTIVSSESTDNIFTSLYLFDIDLLALIDDYCYKVCNNQSNDAIQIKDDVRGFISLVTTDVVTNNPDISSLSDLLIGVDKDIINEQSTSKIASFFHKSKEIEREKDKFIMMHKNTSNYFKYLDKHKYGIIGEKWEWILACFLRLNHLSKEGYKTPCSACKYANRSMNILMKQVFDYNETENSKIFTLLQNTSHKKLRLLRPEILSQLAFSSEQLADIMLSCAYTDIPSEKDIPRKPGPDNLWSDTIELLISLTKNIVNDNDRTAAIVKFENTVQKRAGQKGHGKDRPIVGQLNRAILYYWAACRYYDIASMHHEAVHCIWRIVRVIENYLSVLYDIKSRANSNNQKEIIILPELLSKDDSIDRLTLLLGLLFTQATRIVSRQYNNYDSVEIHELKWLLHKELMDDVDLTRLTLFPDLQSIFMAIVTCKLLLFKLKKGYRMKRWIMNQTKSNVETIEKYSIYGSINEEEYICGLYKRLGHDKHERTFKTNIELNCLKAKLNHAIFSSIVKDGNVRDRYLYGEGNIRDFYPIFYTALWNGNQGVDYFNIIFNAKDASIQSKLDILDFLIYDSIVCLCNIINELPPHNQFSTFSNSFIASIYEDLWIWSKYYEVIYNMYLFYRYYLSENTTEANRLLNKYIPNSDTHETMRKYADKLKKYNVVCKDDFGYRYSKLFMNIRHDMDDATIHHVFLNYSAEMAIKYYRAARGINSEGQEYKNMINNMYVLDDDLRNDTCQSNLADERYLHNSGVIDKKRLAMQRLYIDSRANRLSSYEGYNEQTVLYQQLHICYEDSLNTNTEY